MNKKQGMLSAALILLLLGCLALLALCAAGEKAAEAEPAYRLVRKTYFMKGKPTWIIEYSYDDRGHVIREEAWRPSADGTAPVRYELLYEYDEDGNAIKQTALTHFGDDRPDLRETSRMEYDEAGKRLRVFDENPDGTFRLRCEDIYDPWGQWMGTTENYNLYLYDRYGTFIMELTMGWVRDRQQRIVPDVNAFYDDNNNLLLFTGLSETEGSVSYYFQYDERDRIVFARRRLLSFDLSQHWSEEESFRYGEDGSVTRVFRVPSDQDEDVFVWQSTSTYSADRVLLSRVDEDLRSGQITYEAQYDREGRLLWAKNYTDGELSFLEEVQYRCDERGNLAEEISFANGEEEERIVYEYALR